MTGRLVAASGLAAAALWAAGLTAWGPLLHGAGHHHDAAPVLAAAAALGGWSLMVTAMMLPAASPLIGAVERRRGLVVAGYLGVWIAVGLAAVAAAALAAAIALPAALAAAGAYQFTAHKRRSLARCRQQRLLAEVASGDPSGDALRAGVAHALSTLRCCGPLMALMLLPGLAGPGWMLLAGGVMTVEAATPLGPRIRIPLGILLLGASLLALWAGGPPT